MCNCDCNNINSCEQNKSEDNSILNYNKDNKWDKLFMSIAENISVLSHCVSHKVGCVAVKNKRIIATGINGSPPGMINCDDIFKNYDPEKDRLTHYEWSKKHEIHAEMNLILYCAKNGISLEGATLYTNLQPCSTCMKNLIQSGITKIYYLREYDRANLSNIIIEYMQLNNILIEKLEV